MPDYSQRVIAYLDGSDLRFGYVARHTGEKLQIRTEHGRQDACALKQVAVGWPAPVAEPQATAFIAEAHERVAALVGELDIELLWESVQTRTRGVSVEELAKLYYSQATPDQQIALWRALLADTTYFKRDGLSFEPRAPRHVAELREAAAKQRARRERRERLAQFVATAASAAPGTVTAGPEEEATLGEARALLFGGNTGDILRLLALAVPGKAPQEVALALLRGTGRLPADIDRFLVLEGIDPSFPVAAVELAERRGGFVGDAARAELGAAICFSIDDAETREVDDALSFRATVDGFEVGIHIADVAHFVDKDDALDQAAFERAVTLYLPTGATLMFPERVSCELASLNAGLLRPTLSLFLDFAADGTLKSSRYARAQIVVQHRLTYEEVDAILAGGAAGAEQPPALAAALRSLHEVALKLKQARRANGAFVFERREVIVKVVDDEIALRLSNPGSPAGDIVQEHMVLYNRLAAETARTHELPIIYRGQDGSPGAEASATAVESPREETNNANETQSPTDETAPAPESNYDPAALDALLANMKPSRLALRPLRHAGLGVEAYTQMTSPIRRYTDLIVQRQFVAHIAQSPCPYTSVELHEVMSNSDSLSRTRQRIERHARRYWLLEYLRRQPAGSHYAATVVRNEERDDLVELVDLGIRGFLAHLGTPRAPGSQVQVSILQNEPRRGILEFREQRAVALTDTADTTHS
ncbi:MAG: ribonuclease catalytic domain-containing protein [Planctomycetota bacterium]